MKHTKTYSFISFLHDAYTVVIGILSFALTYWYIIQPTSFWKFIAYILASCVVLNLNLYASALLAQWINDRK